MDPAVKVGRQRSPALWSQRPLHSLECYRFTKGNIMTLLDVLEMKIDASGVAHARWHAANVVRSLVHHLDITEEMIQGEPGCETITDDFDAQVRLASAVAAMLGLVEDSREGIYQPVTSLKE